MMSRDPVSKAEDFPRTTADDRASRFESACGPDAATGFLRIAESTNRADIPSTSVSANASASTDAWSEWPIRLAMAYPEFFQPLRQRSAIECLPECGAGWSDIIEHACVRIGEVLIERERFRFERIKERNGALRIYWGGKLSAKSEAAVRGAIDLAEARSLCFCELCGAQGRLHRDGAILATRCDLHARGEAVPVRPGFENLHLTQKMVVGRQWTVVIRRYDPASDAFIDFDRADAEEC
jgi:hypothetical protein